MVLEIWGNKQKNKKTKKQKQKYEKWVYIKDGKKSEWVYLRLRLGKVE